MKYFLLLLLALCFFACSTNDDSNNELQSLKQEYESLKGKIALEDQLQEQWAEEKIVIDSLLDQVDELKNSAQNDLFDSETIQEKIEATTLLLEEKNQKISQLNQTIADNGSNNPLKNEIVNYTQRIQEQKALINDLQQAVSILETEVSGLKTNQRELTSNIEAKDLTLDEKIRQLQRKETELKGKEDDLRKIARLLKDEQSNSAFKLNKQKVAMAQALIEAVKSVPGAGRKKKQAIIDRAWGLLCEAHLAGVYLALSEMENLKTDNLLYKFVRNKEACVK